VSAKKLALAGVDGLTTKSPRLVARTTFKGMTRLSCFSKYFQTFPGVQALDKVSFEIARDSCHALIGENGAAKAPSQNPRRRLYRRRRPVAARGQPDSSDRSPGRPKLGIAMVHQELAFCPT